MVFCHFAAFSILCKKMWQCMQCFDTRAKMCEVLMFVANFQHKKLGISKLGRLGLGKPDFFRHKLTE